MRGISLFGALLLILTLPLGAAENGADTDVATVATLIKQEGRVQLLRAGEIRKYRADEGAALAAGDMLITLDNSRAELRMGDGSTLVVKDNSRLTLTSPDRVHQQKGTVYYEVRPRLLDRKLSVETDFVVIGVKGTTFIVASREDEQRVSMKEGSVEIAAQGEGYALYRDQDMDEYQRYLREQQQEFKDYQQQQQAEFVAFVKTFELAASRTVAFAGGRAYEQGNSAAIEAEFADFEAFIGGTSE